MGGGLWLWKKDWHNLLQRGHKAIRVSVLAAVTFSQWNIILRDSEGFNTWEACGLLRGEESKAANFHNSIQGPHILVTVYLN